MSMTVEANQAPAEFIRRRKAPTGHNTVDEACRILGLSRSGFYQYVGEGKINIKRILGRPFVSDAEIARIIDGE